MKTTRTIKVVLLGVIAIALIGWLASEATRPPKARAQRINTQHNIVTTPIVAPTSASVAGDGKAR